MTFYSNQSSAEIPGAVAQNWWEGTALFGIMMQYWSLTGDDSNNDAVSEGMYWQRGDDDNYMPSNVSSFIGNDDQLTWGLAAMTAAELDYPQKSSMPSWETLAENVWKTVSRRWDTDHCDGGLRWQIYAYERGYNTKTAISNGALFALSARLARFTNNQTYTDWAEKIWDWSAKTPLLNEKTWEIADSISCDEDCTDRGDFQWSFNYGLYMSGAAYMYNQVSGFQS
jgi:mannan endo-1,6-alpha-mannosidase